MPAIAFIIILTVSWAAIAYTYCVFPILIALLARLRGSAAVPESDSNDALPPITIVVAAHNEERFIESKIQNTWEIDYPADRLTLLIGSDGSSDTTPRLLESTQHSRLQVRIFTQRRGKVSVLNDLMKQADTEIVVLSDANTMLAPDSVRKMVRHFRDPRVGCVNGALSLEHNGGVSGEGLYWKYELWLKKNESRLGFVIGCYGGILAVRRDLYQTLPATTIVEDFVLTMQIMARNKIVRFDHEARATEPASATSHDEWERKVRIGAGDYQALGMTRAVLHPRYGLRAFAFWSHKVLRWCVPFFLIAALGSNLGIVVQRSGESIGVFQTLLAAQTIGIAIACIAYRLPAKFRPPFWFRPISYFYLMNYALFCGFIRWLRAAQPVTWQQAARQAAGKSS